MAGGEGLVRVMSAKRGSVVIWNPTSIELAELQIHVVGELIPTKEESQAVALWQDETDEGLF